MENYNLTAPRYENMKYRYCGKSGLMLSQIALGFWHNFGYSFTPDGKLTDERLPQDYARCRDIVHFAFDNGITYYDLANNYGPPYGSAEECFGKIMADGFKAYRDEIIVATKAGYDMWPGPYGEWGSRKYLMASIDQSLKRMGMDYVDIFYSHRPDPRTPIEETMQALVDIVRAGKALYVGISNYPADMAAKAYDYLAAHDTPCILYQGKYNMMVRGHEGDILPQCAERGVGYVAFSPLNQGLLTDRYLKGIPADSRMARSFFLDQNRDLTPEYYDFIRQVQADAAEQGLSIAQYALRWILQRQEVTSVIVGASSVDQLRQNLKAL